MAKVAVRRLWKSSGGGGIILKNVEEDQLKKTKKPETEKMKEIK